MRPRWANQGMEFLLAVCEPANTRYLTENEFEDLKKTMDDCISHLIGKYTLTNIIWSYTSRSNFL